MFKRSAQVVISYAVPANTAIAVKDTFPLMPFMSNPAPLLPKYTPKTPLCNALLPHREIKTSTRQLQPRMNKETTAPSTTTRLKEAPALAPESGSIF
jgi:hypothetical protein